MRSGTDERWLGRVVLADPTDVRTTAAWVYLTVGLVAAGAYFLLPSGSLEQDLLYDAIGASAVVAIVLGVWMQRPDRPIPWLLLAMGQASFVIGDLLFVYFDHTGERPFPSLADAFYLAGYPIIVTGLFLFIRRRLGGGDRSGLLDAAILTTSAGVLTWTFLMQPALVDSDMDPLSLAISGAYPLADLVLIGVTLGLLVTPGARTTSFRLLILSLGLMLVADQVYALQSLSDTYQSGAPLDLLWMLAYLAIGSAALHPSMRTLTEAHPVNVTWLGPVRLLFLTAAMLTGPLLMTVGREGTDTGLWVIAGGSALLSVLVLARLSGLVGTLARDVEQRRALEERLSHQAYHDPLTGLANRRLFVERVEQALAARRGPGGLAVLFLDLDDFKTVNDELGHAAGDALLAAVAGRLAAACRGTDLAARLGGDEFGVLVAELLDPTEARAVADRIHAVLSGPVEIADRTVPVGVSLGVAVDTTETHSADDLLGAADVAMYRAKAAGKGTVHTAPLDLRADDAGPGRAGVRRVRPNSARLDEGFQPT